VVNNIIPVIRSYESLKAARQYQIQLSRQGLPPANLADLCREINAPKRDAEPAFSDKANAIYVRCSPFTINYWRFTYSGS
jgi:hypothetical protein